jgi:Lon protease-like protein
VKSVQHQKLNLPREAPVMVLPGALLFPNALLPLYIFEPRYRAMLSYALEQDRMFCIAAPYPGVTEPSGLEEFREISSLGLVRACVGREDGTSHLILQGLARVRFFGFVQQQPFRVAQIQELTAGNTGGAEAEELARQLLALCATVPTSDAAEREKLDRQLSHITDPAVLCDIVAHTFLRDPDHRHAALDTLDVCERLRLVHESLRAELA